MVNAVCLGEMSSTTGSAGIWGIAGLLVAVVAYWALGCAQRSKTTQLRGPPRDSWIFGQGRLLRRSKDSVAVVESWEQAYGGAYIKPGPLGSQSVILTDAAAINHFFANMETVYHLGSFMKIIMNNLVGKGILWADGESHKRQRKLISPGFSNVQLREYTPIFFDAAHKLISKWDDMFATEVQSNLPFVVDVQHWLNAISLDSIGLAGFSHNFGALQEARGDVVLAFEQLAKDPGNISDVLVIMLGTVFPFLRGMPTPRNQAIRRMSMAASTLARELLQQSRETSIDQKGDRSVMGLLIRAQSGVADSAELEEEVIAQMKTLMVAGYETTSASLTWSLIELCRDQVLQTQLRDELNQAFPGSDPSHDDITNPSTLPLLDAVVHEVLRLHPAVRETPRVAVRDDVIPLSTPIILPDGSTTDRVVVAKGQNVTVPLIAVNRSRTLWGEDAQVFRPSRWLTDGLGKAHELSSYRHLMTFIDGPKTCLGRSFAVLEMKAVLAVLIRKYAFELTQGPNTPIGKSVSIVQRPKVVGEQGARVPLRIRRL